MEREPGQDPEHDGPADPQPARVPPAPMTRVSPMTQVLPAPLVPAPLVPGSGSGSGSGSGATGSAGSGAFPDADDER